MGAFFHMAGMNIHQLPVKDALKGLHSTANGLSSVAALQRLRDFGPNRMEKVAGMPPVLRLLKEFVQFFSVILWIAAALAFVAEWSAPGQGMARIGFAIITVILVSGAFSFWQEHRVEQTLEALQKLLPPQVNLLRDGSLVRLGVDQLVPGDLVLLEQGDIVPADCRLIEAFGVRVNNATVTGESMALARESCPFGKGRLDPQQKYPAGRDIGRLRTSNGAGLRDRFTHRVWQDRAPRPNKRCRGLAAAPAARLFEPVDRITGGRRRALLLCNWCCD
jgi:magnesium-transporting ATPase (P-type)